MVATRKNGNILGALCRGKHLNHGSEDFHTPLISREPFDLKLLNGVKISEVEKTLAASHQFCRRRFTQKDLS